VSYPGDNKLDRMLARQRELQEKSMGIDFNMMSDVERIAYIKENVLALTDELHEMLGEMGWKSWATSRHINTNAAFGELIDAWHFMMNIAIALMPGNMHTSVVADRFEDYYNHKREKNAKRQEDGYDGVSTKCPRCGRALDDAGAIKERPGDEGPEWHLCAGCGCELNAHFTDAQISQLLALAGSIDT
jgi:hypothetical protein